MVAVQSIYRSFNVIVAVLIMSWKTALLSMVPKSHLFPPEYIRFLFSLARHMCLTFNVNKVWWPIDCRSGISGNNEGITHANSTTVNLQCTPFMCTPERRDYRDFHLGMSAQFDRAPRNNARPEVNSFSRMGRKKCIVWLPTSLPSLMPIVQMNVQWTFVFSPPTFARPLAFRVEGQRVPFLRLVFQFRWEYCLMHLPSA